MLALDSAVPEVTTMLLFEFFPAFVALVSIVAGIWLFMQNLEADRRRAQCAGGRERHAACRERALMSLTFTLGKLANDEALEDHEGHEFT
jgi:hypothetical protein